MIGAVIVAATSDSTATDPLARWLAVGGLVVAGLALLLSVYREWRDRARLEVDLSTSTMASGDGLNYLDALVKVRNRGRRPTSVEQIHFERADGTPESPINTRPTQIPGLEAAGVSEVLHAFGINARQPPVALGEGEILIWSYRLQESDETVGRLVATTDDTVSGRRHALKGQAHPLQLGRVLASAGVPPGVQRGRTASG
jgi:hypothetical protein